MSATITVLDAEGNPVVISAPLSPGRAAAAASNPVVMSEEDEALFQAILGALSQPSSFAGAIANQVSSVILAPATRAVVTIQVVTNGGLVGVNSGGNAVLNGGGTIMASGYESITLRGAAASAAISVVALQDGTELTIGIG